MLVINKGRVNTNTITVKLGNSCIERVKELKILGVVFDEKMSFHPHMKSVSKKCYGSLAKLFSIKHVLSKENKIILVKSIILSVLNYGSIVWLSNPNKIIHNRYDKIIRSSSRFILGKRKFDSVSSEICNDLGFYFSKYRYLYELLCFTNKCTYHTNSGMFVDYIDFSYDCTQSTRNKSFFSPKINTLSRWGKYSLKYAAVNEWLKLDSSVRCNVGNPVRFKTSIFNYCMEMQISKFSSKNADEDDDVVCDIESLFK
jgi:hypothetical protein